MAVVHELEARAAAVFDRVVAHAEAGEDEQVADLSREFIRLFEQIEEPSDDATMFAAFAWQIIGYDLIQHNEAEEAAYALRQANGLDDSVDLPSAEAIDNVVDATLERYEAIHNSDDVRSRAAGFYCTSGYVFTIFGRSEGAEYAYRRAIELFESIDDPADSIVDVAARSWFNLGNALMGSDEAEYAFRRAIELFESINDPADSIVARVARSWSSHGHSLAARGGNESAISDFRHAIDVYGAISSPDDGVIHGIARTCVGLGLALGKLGRADQAIVEFRRAIELFERIRNTDDTITDHVSTSWETTGVSAYLAGAWGELGYVLRNLGRHGEAIDAYWRAIELFESIPGSATVLRVCNVRVRLAGSLVLLAESEVERPTETDRGNRESRYASLRELDPRALVYKVRLDEAEAQYRQALDGFSGIEDVDMETARCHAEYGKLLELRTRFDEAEAHYRQALDGFDGNDSVLIDVADCHARLGGVVGWLGRVQEGVKLAVPAAVFLDAIRYQLDSAADRQAWTTTQAANATRTALNLALLENNGRLVSDLITAARASGVFQLTEPVNLSGRGSGPDDSTWYASADALGAKMVLSAAGPAATVGAFRSLRLAPTPLVQALNGRIGLKDHIQTAAYRYSTSLASLRAPGIIQLVMPTGR